MSVTDKILNLTRQLYPTGRAYRIPKDSDLESLHVALADKEVKAWNDLTGILHSILPDTDYFTVQDANDWERRLGLIQNSGATLAERKLAIIRKMNHPGTIRARQNYRYLEYALQSAGFNVTVHENRFWSGTEWYTQNPESILGALASGYAVHDTSIQHGDLQHGGNWPYKVANHIDPLLDASFEVGLNYKSTFFICDTVLGNFADVPSVREKEFRQLILKIKPAQTVAYLFINYV